VFDIYQLISDLIFIFFLKLPFKSQVGYTD